MNTRPFTYLHCRTLAAVAVTLLCLVPSAPAKIPDEDLIRFVRGYLDAAQQPTPDAEVSHYAMRVRYFNSGTVDQTFVAEDQRRYYKTWPQRSFELLEGPVITEHEGDSAAVKFTIRYDLKAPGRRASGMTENSMRVRRFGDAVKIVAMSEHKVNAGVSPPRSVKPLQKDTPAEIKTSPAPVLPQVAPLPSSPKTPANKPESRDMPEHQTSKADGSGAKTVESQSHSHGKPPRPNPTITKAAPVPNSPGFVYPPGTEHTPRNMLDVRDYSAGQKVKDPRTGQVFIVP